MAKYLFLDLEATVIDHWSNFIPMEGNLQHIKGIINNASIDKVGIFSYAVHNLQNIVQWQTSDFLTRLKDEVSPAVYDDNLLISTAEMCRGFSQNTPYKNPIDTAALWTILCKEVSFLQYVDAVHADLQGTEYHLYDDTVRDMVIAVVRHDVAYNVIFHHANPLGHNLVPEGIFK